MCSFSADWLALREPVDAAARNRELTTRLCDWRRKQGALSVLDLGSGTGANCRFLAPLLGGDQHWRLVDQDPALLAAIDPIQDRSGLLRRETTTLDLAGSWERLEMPPANLVTASALLDLVSTDWLARLVRRCQTWRAAVFIALSYDGTICWEPALAGDDQVRDWINRHQRTDKGFGPALGPDAAPALAARLEERGYSVALRPSPWLLGSEYAPLQYALLTGWVAAVREIAPEPADELAAWAEQRQRLIDQGRARLAVGHWDLFATFTF